MPTLLKFVEKSHALLREVIPDVQDFKDPALQQTIENMCYSILPKQLKAAGGAHDSAAGMAANQWGINKRIFIFTPDGSGEGQLTAVMINPSYTPRLFPGEAKPKMSEAFEGCFSVPLTTGMVRRFESINAVYYTPEGEKVACVMEGWEARVFQHETDHLNGQLFDGALDNFNGPDCVERIIFKDKEEMKDFWENKVRPSRSE
tara:strand:+ start:240 stop:848 length:609 start_codon:yes stop_codon:yes gene_type:complete